MKRQYLVDEKTLYNLMRDSLTLRLLESGGVDNWEWYGDAMIDGLVSMIENRGEDFTKYEDLYVFEDLFLREQLRRFPCLTNHALEDEEDLV